MPTHEDSGQGSLPPDQLGQLRSDVRHVQSDVTDLKSEVRATHQRLDALGDEVDEKLTALRDKVDEKVAALDKKFDEKSGELRGNTDKRFDEVQARFDGVQGKFDGLSKDIAALAVKVDAAKLWAVLLFISMFGSLFVVIARAFKWF